MVRAASRVNIFDMYYDKFGSNGIVSIEYGPGLMSPKLWGVEKPVPQKRRRKKIERPEE